MTKEDLKKYTKDELIEAIMRIDKWYGTTISHILEEIRRNKISKSYDEITEKSNQATKDYIEANKKYNDYLFEIARKYNIVNDKGNFRWGDWFCNATRKEYNEAMALEKDAKNKLEEMNRLVEECKKADKELDL